MKSKYALVLSFCFACAANAAEPAAPAQAPMSDKERIDFLIRQNKALVDENERLHGLCERPKTKEEAFAACMQAAKGDKSPMAAESIGEHCDQLLKK